MPGPAQKHSSTRVRRNNTKAGFRTLSGGRTGPVPPWPLQPDIDMTARLEVGRDRVAALQVEIEGETDGRKKGRLRRELNKLEMANATLALQIEQVTDSETSLWAELWSTPQAILWEETRSSREVAQYVRWKIRAEQGELKAASEARQLSDRLALNPLALKRMGVEVAHGDHAAAGGRGETGRAARRASRGGDDPRLHVVPGGA
jgi:hypothetical protein